MNIRKHLDNAFKVLKWTESFKSTPLGLFVGYVLLGICCYWFLGVDSITGYLAIDVLVSPLIILWILWINLVYMILGPL